ncbi:hypothetical protein BLOT_007078 [Blomia tropicalis]|nr:hypothetical protein BLOT_007078 [Blomia tropicalis]
MIRRGSYRMNVRTMLNQQQNQPEFKAIELWEMVIILLMLVYVNVKSAKLTTNDDKIINERLE